MDESEFSEAASNIKDLSLEYEYAADNTMNEEEACWDDDRP